MVLEMSFYLDKLSNLTRSLKNNATQTPQHCSAPESRADPQPVWVSLLNQPTGSPCPAGHTKHLVLSRLCYSSNSAPDRDSNQASSQAHVPQLLCEILLPSRVTQPCLAHQPLFPGQLRAFSQPARARFFSWAGRLSPSLPAKDPPCPASQSPLSQPGRLSCLASQAQSSPWPASWNTQPVLPARARFSGQPARAGLFTAQD